jgi:hypothetical protein
MSRFLPIVLIGLLAALALSTVLIEHVRDLAKGEQWARTGPADDVDIDAFYRAPFVVTPDPGSTE